MSALVEILRVEQPEPSKKAWDSWDRMMKRKLSWWSALKRGGTDTIGNQVVCQWHWEHRMHASWRIYSVSPGVGWLRHLGMSRSHGCLTVALWFTGFIVARAAPGARDVPSAFYALQAPAIHSESGEYSGGGRDGATAKEWPDLPPVTSKPQSYRGFLRGFFS